MENENESHGLTPHWLQLNMTWTLLVPPLPKGWSTYWVTYLAGTSVPGTGRRIIIVVTKHPDSTESLLPPDQSHPAKHERRKRRATW
jgi:hypothetical protein